MRQITSVRDALQTIERGCIVDEAENALPPRVVESLRKRAFGDKFYFKSHVRYVGCREIWWFCE